MRGRARWDPFAHRGFGVRVQFPSAAGRDPTVTPDNTTYHLSLVDTRISEIGLPI